MARTRNPWPALVLRMSALGLEASSVMALRTLKIAAGGVEAAAEARRMVLEKVEAASALQAKALGGGLGTTPEAALSRTLAHYRPKVRANYRRLTGQKRRAGS